MENPQLEGNVMIPRGLHQANGHACSIPGEYIMMLIQATSGSDSIQT